MTAEVVSPRVAGATRYRSGGHEYSLITVANCLTCNSPYRFDIEDQILAGRTYRLISEFSGSQGERFAISGRAIGDHYRNGHMALEQTAVRQIVEARANRVGKRIEDSVESLVDGITLLETVVQKTFEAVARGTLKPEIRDGIRAAKLLSDLGEYDGANVDQQAYVDAFMVYQDVAEQVMGKEAFAEFGKALSENPVLKALAARYEGESVPGEVVEERVEGDSQG